MNFKTATILITFLSTLLIFSCKARQGNSTLQDSETFYLPEADIHYYLISLEDFSRDPEKTILNTYSSAILSEIKSEGNMRFGVPCWAVSLLFKKDPESKTLFGKLFKNADPKLGYTVFEQAFGKACESGPLSPIPFASKKTSELDQSLMTEIAKKINQQIFSKGYTEDDIFAALGDSFAKTGACVVECEGKKEYLPLLCAS